ncbi:hypothetical protein OH76DRAFT_1408377 [Lentinus brumalis]|uniref:DUF6535 domain-containing protein n=1 Tax=Lentinus brumalis TaxID=2498619 RepID=A0A371CXW0_9APHY|nr:hypothetical protein OH76DRAFT_1408377 [Polyporus brumalis]
MASDETAKLVAPTPATAGQSLDTMPEQADGPAWKFPTPDEIRAELSAEFTKEEKERVWTEASAAVKTYHEDLVRRWKEEMDTLLVYAGLFSAVLTAFNVQSYQLLQPGSTDSTVALLQEISSQLSSFTVSPHFVNSTRSSPGYIQSPFHASTSAVWLNTLWFSSLVFSLASASIALFVKQWLYEATVQGTSRESARLRQYHLNGLLRWSVGTIVTALPILLQLALVLFLVGLLVLLWTLHSTVAAITSTIVAFLFSFFLIVTILPVLEGDCSYRSPASLVSYIVIRHLRNRTMHILRRLTSLLCHWHAYLVGGIPPSFINRLRRFAYQRRDLDMPTWRGRDQHAIHEQVSALDRAIVTTAYTATSDTKIVSYMPTIFPDLPPNEVAKVFRDMSHFEQEEWGQGSVDVGFKKDPMVLPFLVLRGLRHMLLRTDKGTAAWREDMHYIYRRFCLPIDASANQRFAELACRTLCQLAVEDPSLIFFYKTASVVMNRTFGEGGACHTFDTLCHVKAMVDHHMGSGSLPAGFEGYRKLSAAIHSILQCIYVSVSGRAQLSPTQTDAMLLWGRQSITRICQWLRDLEWRGLHAECLARSRPGDPNLVLAFPHIASGYLVRYTIDPLLDVCSTTRGLALVPEDLVRTVEHAWSSAQLIYPARVGVDDVDFIWCSGLEVIDARLAELRAAVVTRIPTARIARKRIVHPL